MTREPCKYCGQEERYGHNAICVMNTVEELRAEIEQLKAESDISDGLLTDAKVEIERLRAIGLELLAVAERLSPAQHSLARVQIDKARAALEPKP